YAGAWGAVALSGPYGIATIDNDATISAYAHTHIGSSDALGAYVLSVAGTSTLVNHGEISAVARAERGIVNVTVDYAEATGVRAISLPYGAGESVIDNYGDIAAHTSTMGGIGYANGVQAYGQLTSVLNAADASIIATVDAELFGGAFATGLEAGGKQGVGVVNDGAIVAYGHANAYSVGTDGFYGAAGASGISVNASYQGVAKVVNNGDVDAIAIAENSVRWAQGGAGATGIYAYAKYGTEIVNAGDVHAIADAQFGIVSAYGVVAHDKYSSSIVNAAGANIVARASVGSLAGDQSAGLAVAFGTKTFGNGTDHAVTYNAGSIVSHAVVTPDGTMAPIGSMATAFGSATGYNSGVLQGALVNAGSIEAAASADFGYATAYGAFVRTQEDSAIANSGDIRASASADGGNAFAVGSYAFSLHRTVSYSCDPDGYNCDYAHPIIDVDGGKAAVDNRGDILATSDAAGGVGYSYGAVALGALKAGITNAGHITAVADADDALAVGALANSSDGDVTLQNSGVIGAKASGDTANANGVLTRAADGIRVDNSGSIIAAAYGAHATATAVSMQSGGGNVLNNTGTIAALGDGTRIAIVSGDDATATLVNSGSITGAILTGAMDDRLDNASGGIWHAIGESDFGAGDDHVVNRGMIFMDDAAIRLGGYISGNTFENSGTIAVSGSANVLDMDNPYAVINNGVITLVDGFADDRLTLVGDLDGQGAIDVDVSASNAAGDRLYVDGVVVGSAAQTVNVNLVDLPHSASVNVPLINASGVLAGSFVLGSVQYAQDGFLAMDFGLVQASNAISLGIDVTGLNTTGSLAASIAPGVQDLLAAQVGTWRERMGVLRPARSATPSPWMRVFSRSGEIDPGHDANFGEGGDFDVHQSNHGWELGLDVQPFDHLSVGAMIAKSDGSQDIADGGRDRFDGRTFGLYATWLADNGFYLDVSNRWTGIDARLRAPTTAYATRASAQAFNVEAGFRAWTTRFGLNVVPQAQYTRTEVGDIGPLRSAQSVFVNDGGTSERVRIGVAFDKNYQAAGYTWTPYGSLNVLHEFDGDYGHSVNGGLLGTLSTEGTSAMVELGLAARRDQLSVTTGLDWTSGGATRNAIGAQLVLRYGW
ncbi:MAG: autotransporter outer membrane beta-barrel domain-containing protein, partial [Luteimonas sp.]